MEDHAGRCCVIDGAFDPALVHAAADVWPAADAPWVRYDTPIERKAALHQWEHIPQPCAQLLGLMAALPACERLGIPPAVPDLSLYGAGLHAMEHGGHLGMHLDADRHKRLGFERAANAILFLSDWREEWGGALELRTADPPLRIFPAFNRLVLFATTALHGVPEPLECPPEVSRKSLALYWWRPAEAAGVRPRAVFFQGGREVER